MTKQKRYIYLLFVILLFPQACKKTVTQTAVTGITLSPKNLNLVIDEIRTITATIEPTTASDKTVKWASSDATIVKVDNYGNIIGIALGKATITATTTDGAKTENSKISVTPGNATLSILSLANANTTISITPIFNSTITNYTATVEHAVSNIVLTATPTELGATITINDTSSTTVNLVIGNNSIQVKVRAKDQTTIKTYTIIVTRQPS